MSQYHLRRVLVASVFCGFLEAIFAAYAIAEGALAGADVVSFQNQAVMNLQGTLTRPIRAADWYEPGDTISTQGESRVDLRFTDGTFTRLGEQTIFDLVPNSRHFRLLNGTALFLVPPDAGTTTVATANVSAVTEGAALIFRHIAQVPPEQINASIDYFQDITTTTGRTLVMVLADASTETVKINLPDGRSTSLRTGQMAVVDGRNLYLFEFDVDLFYETSPLIQDLRADKVNPAANEFHTLTLPEPLSEGTEQPSFKGEYLLNPDVIDPGNYSTNSAEWLYPVDPAGSAEATNEPVNDDPSSFQHEGSLDNETELLSPKQHEFSSVNDISRAPTGSQ